MEGLIQHNNLSIEEKKNVYLAVAAGCLKSVCYLVPGPEHMKKKRVCNELYKELIQDISPLLPMVATHNISLFETTIKASENVFNTIVKESDEKLNVMLNLAGFCLNELPLKKRHWDKYNSLFELWKTAMRYHDIKSGERIFARIDSEVDILVAQRGGIIL